MATYTGCPFFFCGVENQMEGSNGRIECDLRSAIFRGTRGRSNQPSSSVASSTGIVNININVCEDDKYRS